MSLVMTRRWRDRSPVRYRETRVALTHIASTAWCVLINRATGGDVLVGALLTASLLARGDRMPFKDFVTRDFESRRQLIPGRRFAPPGGTKM